MPTHEETPPFWRDWSKLSRSQQKRFSAAVDEMIEDLKAKRPFRPRLRVKRFQSLPGVFEMTWDEDGRGLFSYGSEKREGEAHIIWLRVGTHDIFK